MQILVQSLVYFNVDVGLFSTSAIRGGVVLGYVEGKPSSCYFQ